jgi:release factor glutamine methyltransferase
VTVEQALKQGTHYLRSKGLRFPRQDTELILASILKRQRTYVFSHPRSVLSEAEEKAYYQWLHRRGDHYPIQYLRGEQEFYGRPFKVNPSVLIPRPETETLVTAALKFLRPRQNPLRILDIGTGSGCIAITLACENTNSTTVATDISMEALHLATENAVLNDCRDRVQFLHANLCSAFRADDFFDLITANPPYVPTDQIDQVDQSVRSFEPPEAVFAGPDGLEVYPGILENAKPLLKPDGRLLVELGEGTQSDVRQLASNSNWRVLDTHADLAGIERCLVLQPA